VTGWKLGGPDAQTAAKEPLRIYISQRWQKRLIWTGVVLAGCSVWFIGANGGMVRAGWLLLGAAAALGVLNIASRVPAQECSMCRKSRRAVNRLVAAPSVAICDQCAPYPLAIILEQLEREGKTAESLLLLLRALPPGMPPAAYNALFERALGAEPSAEQLSALVAEGFRVEASEAVLGVLSAIPESERSAADFLNSGVCLGELGRTEEALAANDKVRELDPEGLGASALNNSVWYRISAAGGLDAAGLERCLAELEEAKELLRAQGQAEVRLARCFGTEAEARRLAGDPHGALGALDEADKLCRASDSRLLIRARADAALGNAPAARRSAQRAADKALLGSKTQRAALELLSSLDARGAAEQTA
jgi:tetratricopeptide (TPR) repeat protein